MGRHAPVRDPSGSKRTWPVADCPADACSWDTRGRYDGAEPCAGITTPDCLAAQLADKAIDARHRIVVTLTR